MNGLSAESDAATIAAAVKGALPKDAILLGFSAEGGRRRHPPVAREGDQLARLRLAARALEGRAAGDADGTG